MQIEVLLLEEGLQFGLMLLMMITMAAFVNGKRESYPSACPTPVGTGTAARADLQTHISVTAEQGGKEPTASNT